MDISELWRPLGVVIVLVSFVVASIFGKRFGRRWLRWLFRGAAISGATLTALVLLLIIVGEYSCTARAPVAYSPDGKRVAILTWGLQGATGLDWASVDVRRRYSPLAQNVYSGPGGSIPDAKIGGTDPQIHWIDSTHLLVRYHIYVGYQQRCTTRVLDVDVICETLPYKAGVLLK